MKIENKIQKNINLAELTTFKIGGPAKFFVAIETKDELSKAVAWAEKQQEKIYILGGGSNILVNDNGVDGLVIKLDNKELKLKKEIIISSAGVELAQVVDFAKENNLSGLEWAVGIPGTIGGAVRGNAGAYGSCTADSVKKVEAFDLDKQKFIKLNKDNCDFTYRDSIFKQNSNLIIWQVEFDMHKEVLEKIKELMGQYLQSRLHTKPSFPSAGCVFKNLMAEELIDQNEAFFRQAQKQGKIKGDRLGCGYLIDTAGLMGKQIGGAKIGPHHANFIVNYSQAKAQDVKDLIKEVKQQVKSKFDIELQEEIQYFGF